MCCNDLSGNQIVCSITPQCWWRTLSKVSVCVCASQAKESIEQLVYLCRTDKEDVRDAAKQALLVLGKQ